MDPQSESTATAPSITARTATTAIAAAVGLDVVMLMGYPSI